MANKVGLTDARIAGLKAPATVRIALTSGLPRERVASDLGVGGLVGNDQQRDERGPREPVLSESDHDACPAFRGRRARGGGRRGRSELNCRSSPA